MTLIFVLLSIRIRQRNPFFGVFFIFLGATVARVDVFPDVDESRASPDSKAWSSTHINMRVPRWTAEEIKAYVDGLGSPDVHWASFGLYPTIYEPMVRAAYNDLL